MSLLKSTLSALKLEALPLLLLVARVSKSHLFGRLPAAVAQSIANGTATETVIVTASVIATVIGVTVIVIAIVTEATPPPPQRRHMIALRTPALRTTGPLLPQAHVPALPLPTLLHRALLTLLRQAPPPRDIPPARDATDLFIE
jgi:hypothetical protein